MKTDVRAGLPHAVQMALAIVGVRRTAALLILRRVAVMAHVHEFE